MTAIIVSREVLDTIHALFPVEVLPDSRKVRGGWAINITDEAYRRVVANQGENETVSDVLLRLLRELGRSGMRQIHREMQQRARRAVARRRRTRRQ